MVCVIKKYIQQNVQSFFFLISIWWHLTEFACETISIPPGILKITIFFSPSTAIAWKDLLYNMEFCIISPLYYRFSNLEHPNTWHIFFFSLSFFKVLQFFFSLFATIIPCRKNVNLSVANSHLLHFVLINEGHLNMK